MKRIGLLLNGKIQFDSRVIKVINTLSKDAIVDLYYINGNVDEDCRIFNNNVRIFSFRHPSTFLQKTYRHSFFVYEFNFFYRKLCLSGERYDVIYCNDLPTLNSGLKYKKKFGAELIYDSHEVYIETVNQFYTKKKNFIKNILFDISIQIMKISGRFYESRAIKRADVIITVNNSIANYFEKRYKLEKVEVIMNVPLLEEKQLWDKDLREELGIDKDDFIVIYQGILNMGRGLISLVEAFRILPSKYKLLILGDGILFEDLERIINEFEIGSQVIMKGRAPIEYLHNYTKLADIGVNLLETYNLSTYYALPNKLFEYMHAEVPVLCTKTKESVNIINKYKIGFLTNINAEDIANKIIESSNSDLSFYIDNCNKAKKDLNWQAQEDLLKKLVLNTKKI